MIYVPISQTCLYIERQNQVTELVLKNTSYIVQLSPMFNVKACIIYSNISVNYDSLITQPFYSSLYLYQSVHRHKKDDAFCRYHRALGKMLYCQENQFNFRLSIASLRRHTRQYPQPILVLNSNLFVHVIWLQFTQIYYLTRILINLNINSQ